MSIPQVLSFPSSSSFPMRMGSLFFAAIEVPNPPIVSVQNVFQKDDAAHILYRDKKSGGQEGITVLNLSGRPRLSRESRAYVAERPIMEPTSYLGTVTEMGLWVWPLPLGLALAPVVLGARQVYGLGERMIWKMDRHAHAHLAAFRGRLDPAIYGALKMALRNEWMPPSLQGASLTMRNVRVALEGSHRLDFYVASATSAKGRLVDSEWLDTEGFTIARARNESNDAPRGKPRGIRCILPLDGGGDPLASSGETRLRAGGEGDHCHPLPEKGRGPIGALRPIPLPSREREWAVTPPQAAGNHLVDGVSVKRVDVSFMRFTGKSASELFAVKPQSLTEMTRAYVDSRDVDFTSEVREYNASRRRET